MNTATEARRLNLQQPTIGRAGAHGPVGWQLLPPHWVVPPSGCVA